jgi:Uma2 family endonuclease
MTLSYAADQGRFEEMATVIEPSATLEKMPGEPAATAAVITPEELLAIRDRPMPELVGGVVVERPTKGMKSDRIAAELVYWILAFVKAGDLGSVNGAQGSYQIFPNEPGKVRVPDVSFIRKGREASVADGHGKVVPDLVVEVVSPNDLAGDLEEKVADFLRAGVPLVWVVDPGTRTVRVVRGDGSAAYLRGQDVLRGDDVLPGFELPLATLFQVLG